MKRTQAGRASRFIERFLEEFPDIQSLAQAELKHIQDVVAPIGLADQRAMSLKNFAVYVQKKYEGKIPTSWELIKQIPGLGDYSAAAVAYSAFGERCVAIDTNTLRLFKRLAALTPTKNDERWCPDIRELGNTVLRYTSDPKIFNWALLDLAALICKPANPLCAVCPLNSACQSAFKI